MTRTVRRMRVLLFGGTGMVGRGVLRECLVDVRVERVLSVGRSALGEVVPPGPHRKLQELLAADLTRLDADLAEYDACLFCLGVSSVGMSEDEYRRVTHDLTLAIARPLAERNPAMRFLYVSGAGTNADGRQMWARVKGATENALFELPFEAYAIRPGVIVPMHGIRSRTRLYDAVYSATRVVWPALRRVAPNAVTTTEELGVAMLRVAREGARSRVLGTKDFHALATS